MKTKILTDHNKHERGITTLSRYNIIIEIHPIYSITYHEEKFIQSQKKIKWL